jgi:hypothetical protein
VGIPSAKRVSGLQRAVRQLQSQASGLAGPLTAGVSSFNGRMGFVKLLAADLVALGVAFVDSTVASFNGREGAVTLIAADVSGAGGVLATEIGAAGGVAGLDASSRLMIPAGTSAPTTGTGAIGVGTLVGWIPVDIGGVISKIPIFQ